MDQDSRDDMLKLVRYKVLFVKREYEHAFEEAGGFGIGESGRGGIYRVENRRVYPGDWRRWRRECRRSGAVIRRTGTGESTGRRSSRTGASRNICSDCRMKIKSICGSITRCWIGIHAKDSNTKNSKLMCCAKSATRYRKTKIRRQRCCLVIISAAVVERRRFGLCSILPPEFKPNCVKSWE